MKWKAKISIIMLVAFTTVSCNMQKWPGPDEIAISWEVLSNTFDEQAMVRAKFIVENNSETTLSSNNWELYFNQSPRFLIKTHEESLTQVERISGGWYRIFPEEGFSLLPGEKVSIVYESRYWWIKETDAPQGLYFVFHDEKERESIIEVENYKILPFEREEQTRRHYRDQEPVPTPEISYYLNGYLKKLPENALHPVIPSPVNFDHSGDSILFERQPTVYYEEGLEFEAHYLKEQIQRLCSCEVEMMTGFSGEDYAIDLRLDSLSISGKTSEAYKLEVNDNQNISLIGADKAGVFYGIQSLIAMVDPGYYYDRSHGFYLPVVTIEDAPRFGYRGVHVDVARNFHSKESLLKVMDILAYYKINTLHLHLTDDEGWRLEIRKLPELTRVGAQRGHTGKNAPALHPSYGSGPFPNAKGKHGSGYYSQEDFVEILEYAKKRHISVIPEINLPGHARAAVKSMEARYEYYLERGDETAANEYRLVDPDETSEYLSAQLYNDNVVNVARESVYHFFETVLDEVIVLYERAGANLDVVHVGGDEVPSGAWSASPLVNKKMQELPHIGKPANMHAYFTGRILEILSDRGLKMAGWEEVAMKEAAQGGHIPNVDFAGGDVIPYVWNNLWGAQDLAYRLANRGFPVVLCHVSAFYFDLAYNKSPVEPGLYWAGFVDTQSAWHYSPFNVFHTTLKDNMGHLINPETDYMGMERLYRRSQENILGVQAQLWSETITGPERLEYYLLPKLAGFAETAWAQERIWENTGNARVRARQVEQQWNLFANTLGFRELPRLSYLFGGYNYRIPPPGAVVENGIFKANTEFPGLTLRYTIDGTEPEIHSILYSQPVKVGSELIRIKAFDRSGHRSRSVEVKNVEIEATSE